MCSLMAVLEWLKSLVLSSLLTQKHCSAKAVYMAKHWKAHKWQLWECQQAISKCKHASLLKTADIVKGKKENEAKVLLSLIPVLWGATKSLGHTSLRGLITLLGPSQHPLPQHWQGWLCKPTPSCPPTHTQLDAWKRLLRLGSWPRIGLWVLTHTHKAISLTFRKGRWEMFKSGTRWLCLLARDAACPTIPRPIHSSERIFSSYSRTPVHLCCQPGHTVPMARGPSFRTLKKHIAALPSSFHGHSLGLLGFSLYLYQCVLGL